MKNLVENERQRRAARCEGPSHLELTSDVALDSSCQEPIETDKAPNIVSTDDELDDSYHDRDFNLADCELNSSDSDDATLAEIKRRHRRRKQSSRSVAQDFLSIASTSTAVQIVSSNVVTETEVGSPSQPVESAENSVDPGPHEDLVRNTEDNVVNRGRSRKRVRSEDQWKKNLIRSRRNAGESYVSETGKSFKARVLAPPCGSACPRKCTALISDEERRSVFQQYWKIGNKKDQRQFICKNVEKTSIQRTHYGKDTKRQVTYHYFLIKDGKKRQVCQTFFLNTLGIKKDFVYGSVNMQSDEGILKGSLSGKHGKQKKWSAESIATVVEHIKSFPKVDSHYCRKECSKGFLDQSLSIKEMHRLYIEHCKSKGVLEVVSSDKYNRIFTEKFNLSFFRPKKDRCDECVAFENIANPDETQKMIQAKHLESKEKARAVKTEAKERSKANDQFGAVCFDMQQLLPCPKSNSSTFYYKRKLYVHNLTMYDLGTAEVRCFMWPEFEARRGASEVATCLAKFIEEKSNGGCKDLTLFSDNCPGQNRNRFVAFMLNETNKTLHMDKLCLTFLQKGHTENENDSVHSVIERATKHAVIYSPEQWYSAVRSARKSKTPYHVEELTHAQFIDCKTMSKSVKNLNMDDEGNKVKWSSVRQFIVYGTDPQALYLTYEYGGAEKRVDLCRRQRGSGNSLAPAQEASPPLRFALKWCIHSSNTKTNLMNYAVFVATNY